ncbi:unnamed protein product [Anisakis simplex]|uniref:FAT domain-containing protein n=1 Tax=Anisakis simplex TaxID=6269 RepID=A0A0M3JGS2_ANISI|nr:unnamed protein product [Anisakis simplex]
MKPGSEMSHLCAKCCLKLGEWYEIIASSRTSQQQLVAIGIPPSANPVMMGVASLMLSSNQQLQSVQPTPVPATTLNPLSSPTMNSSPTHNQAIKFYSYATNYDPNWYKAWHKLASAYFNSAIYQPKSEVRFLFFVHFVFDFAVF